MSLGDIRNLDYTVLLCTKLQETKAFYRDVMGFALVRDGERWVEFHVGAAVLALKLRGETPTRRLDLPVRRITRENAGTL